MMLMTESSRFRLRDSLRRSIDALPPDLRSLIILRYRENFSYGDIAQRLNVSTDGISSRLCQAALRLHAKLGILVSDNLEDLPAEPAMMSADCRIVERCLPLYSDDALDSGDRAFVASHLLACAGCSAKVQRFGAIKSMLRAAFNRGEAPTQSAPCRTLRSIASPCLNGLRQKFPIPRCRWTLISLAWRRVRAR